MNLDRVILHLRENAPIFAGQVAGAAEYAHAVADQAWMKLPAAYVIPLQDEAGPNENQTGLLQYVTEKIGVIVVLDNEADRRGQAAATCAVDTVRAALFRALLTWRPEPARHFQGFAYDGGGIVPDGLTRAWLRWQFDFAVISAFGKQDAWQEPSLPLTGVEMQLTGKPSLLSTIPFPPFTGET